ncbi:MAG: hypothetical protein ABJZ55_00925 [Fuerstiella sp.]
MRSDQSPGIRIGDSCHNFQLNQLSLDFDSVPMERSTFTTQNSSRPTHRTKKPASGRLCQTRHTAKQVAHPPLRQTLESTIIDDGWDGEDLPI